MTGYQLLSTIKVAPGLYDATFLTHGTVKRRVRVRDHLGLDYALDQAGQFLARTDPPPKAPIGSAKPK